MYPVKVDKFYNSFLNGAREVIHNKTLLNQINVFPVADGDTGSNLSSLMRSIIHHSKLQSNFETTLDSIADSALIGARGNSGLIFAQYIQGLCNGLSREDMMTKESLLRGAEEGMLLAYDSVHEPVEGTILTSMRAFHESLNQYIDEVNSIESFLELGVQAIQKSVHDTTEQLIQLKRANVVDAGAKGFLYFIKGFLDGIKGHFKQSEIEEEEIASIMHNHEEDIRFRYCTEALIQHKNQTDFQTMLEPFGDSIVVIKGKKKTRLHIHTDQPDKVFELISDNGLILEQKVDDMVKQNDIVHARKYDTVIVTDSIADLPQSVIDHEQIYVIHLNILIDEENYIDKLTINNERLLSLSKKRGTHPSTSLPNISNVENALNYLSSYYKHILILPVSKALSGTYNVFQQVIDKNNLSHKIHLLDTMQNSVAQGLIIYEASKCIADHQNLDTILETLSGYIDRSKILVRVRTLDNMIASGRLSMKAGKIASKLKVRPIITLKNGQGAIEQVAFGNKQSTKKLLSHLEKVHKKHPIRSYAITYIDDVDAAKILAESIEKILGKPYAYMTKSSSIIALGAGSGALAVGYITE